MRSTPTRHRLELHSTFDELLSLGKPGRQRFGCFDPELRKILHFLIQFGEELFGHADADHNRLARICIVQPNFLLLSNDEET